MALGGAARAHLRGVAGGAPQRRRRARRVEHKTFFGARFTSRLLGSARSQRERLLLHVSRRWGSGPIEEALPHVAAVLVRRLRTHPTEASTANRHGLLPLHEWLTLGAGCFALFSKEEHLAIIGALIAAHPPAASSPTPETRLLPLHLVGKQTGGTPQALRAVVTALVEANPAALGATDAEGKVPLHAAVQGRIAPPPSSRPRSSPSSKLCWSPTPAPRATTGAGCRSTWRRAATRARRWCARSSTRTPRPRRPPTSRGGCRSIGP